MPAIRTVSNIKANLLRPSLTSHFEVEIPVPSSRNFRAGLGATKQDKLNLMCSEAVLPGSNLATVDITNDYAGVTERHAHRRVFDDRIDLSFYVDAEDYTPIRFFEGWIEFIANGRFPGSADNMRELMAPNYYYRMNYPSEYIAKQGLKVRKFERDHRGMLEYQFVNSFPLAINSMPVSYDTSSLLKCNVSFSYIRYAVVPATPSGRPIVNPFNQAQYNTAGLSGLTSNLSGGNRTNITGNRNVRDRTLGANDQLRSIGSGLA